ncbi:rhamnulose-1-phosphate aldolase [Acidaminobacter sp. JC074]|uniref:rhamnulose-1-phosphate aldolase n=1 Tax=Acidaminobacter sp. JC074 TaxID=2530199 RepID=UPI001F101EB0|nr:rhamnulose-1-phosphate aldolase [Acidaminobacter sp. JC074]MCH4887042.1 rhamnulose-1-phosphate aldolase [Acidaminobacter sp. JC074]
MDIINRFCKMAYEGHLMGWHERNGGNLSYRMTYEDIDSMKKDFIQSQWIDLDVTLDNLSNEFFIVTGSGKYFSNVMNSQDAIGIIELNDSGDAYRIRWGLEGSKPTSELPTHLMNHSVKKALGHRVIYHAHTTNVIALTFVLPLEDKVFTKKLWQMATECPVVFPEGLGVVEWMVPGGRAIAEKTSQKMKDYNACVWAHHGLFCSGRDFDETFGLMHTIEKSAEILIKVMSTGINIKNTITNDNFNQVAEAFQVDLMEI